MRLPNESIKMAVRDIIDKEMLTNYRITISPGCEKGNNFVGIINKIKITGFNLSGKKVTKNLFCKSCTQDETAREGFCMRNLFLREIKIYNEVFIEMKKLVTEKKAETLLTFMVDCLSTGDTEQEEYLILNDIAINDDFILRRGSEHDVPHTLCVMKALAKLHALSFVMKDNNPKVFQQLTTELPDLYYKENNLFEKYNAKFLENAKKKLVFKGLYKEKWEEFCKNYHKLGADCTNGQLAEPFAVVCHGDIWSNNIMFKYEDDKPIKIRLVDWQIARYCSPVLDVVHYIFGCTDRSFRKDNYETVINYYYDNLREFIKLLGSDPDKLFKVSDFFDQLKKFGKFGLIKAIVVKPLVLNDLRDLKSVQEFENSSKDLTDNQNTVGKLTTMWKDVVEEMVDLGYL